MKKLLILEDWFIGQSKGDVRLFHDKCGPVKGGKYIWYAFVTNQVGKKYTCGRCEKEPPEELITQCLF